MIKRFILFLVIGLFVNTTLSALSAASVAVSDPIFAGQFGPIPPEIAKKMKLHSWRDGCPVPIKDLSYLKVSFWGYDKQVLQGELIVHRSVAPEVLKIFIDMFQSRFLIEKMRLIHEYEGSEDKSMADNNTSAFNCRSMTGRPGVFSRHSYGKAIDINPITNPYITKSQVLPPAGKAYVDRTQKVPGIIVENDACHKAFVSRGWTWGGSWRSIKDYQHFEKKRKHKKKGK